MLSGTNALNADELGEKGQSRFNEICADAQLICNQSVRDRTGWDFIVEFPFTQAKDKESSLEERVTPISCHIQVKTLLEKNDRFQVRLTAAERLAKELKPTFIYVFKVNATKEFTGAYLIHLIDNPLGKILKRLRKEDIDGNAAANKKFISMSASKDGVAITPTGDDLRVALERFCGDDMRAYASRKAEKIATLGLGERPFEMKMSLHAESTADLVDVFLGLKKNIPASEISAAHVRFGIRKPLPDLSDGTATITLSPAPIDKCTIAVRTNPLDAPAVFRGDVFFPPIPNLRKEHFKVLFQTDFFSMVFSRNGWNISTRTDIEPQTPSMWAAYWRFGLAMAVGQGTIQIIPDTLKVDATVKLNKSVPKLDPRQCEWLVSIFEYAAELLKFAGVKNEPRVAMQDVLSNAEHISSAHKLLHPENGPAPFALETESVPGTLDPIEADMIYADCLRIGDVYIGYYGLGKIVGGVADNKIVWKSDNIVLKRLIQLRSFPAGYENFLEEAKKETGCPNLCMPQYGSPEDALLQTTPVNGEN